MIDFISNVIIASVLGVAYGAAGAIVTGQGWENRTPRAIALRIAFWPTFLLLYLWQAIACISVALWRDEWPGVE